jgi:hypothetical protein
MRRALILLAVPALLAAQPPRQAPQGQEPERARLEGEIRRGFARAVRQRVGLNDDQMRRLAPLTQRHEQERRQIQMDERRSRLALQAELMGATPDTAAVARLLDALRDVQRRRYQLIETEHRDLATVMNPGRAAAAGAAGRTAGSATAAAAADLLTRPSGTAGACDCAPRLG